MARVEPIEIEIRRASPHALVAIAGELDTSNVVEFYAELAQLAREGICHVALNLAELDFIDSTGLSALVTAHKRAIEAGGELLIFSPPADIRRTLKITGLDGFLNVRPACGPSTESS